MNLPIEKKPEPKKWWGIVGTLFLYLILNQWSKSRSVEPLPDLAVAEALDPSNIDETILGIGKSLGYAEPEVGQLFRKSGRTTEVLEAMVTHLGWDGKVSYNRGDRFATNQVILKPLQGRYFSRPGDSGSGFVNKDNKIAGILAHGGGGRTGGDNIKDVLCWFDKWKI